MLAYTWSQFIYNNLRSKKHLISRLKETWAFLLILVLLCSIYI